MLLDNTNLGLELKVAVNAILLILSYAGIPQLQHHLAEQYPSSVHVRHCDDIFYSKIR